MTTCPGSWCSIFKLYCCTRSEEHTSELQSRLHLVCRLLLEKKKINAQQRGDDVQERHSNREISRGRHRHPLVSNLLLGYPLGVAALVCGPDSSFFFNDPATTEIYTLSLHDALPI